MPLVVKISAKNAINNSKLGAMYQIDVECEEINYTVFKSYNSFFEMNSALQKEYPKIRIPPFPTISLKSQMFVQSNIKNKPNKIHAIHEYIMRILEIPEISTTDIVLNFFEVPLTQRQGLFSTLTRPKKTTIDDFVGDFLWALHDKRNTTNVYKQFESRFLDERPNLDKSKIVRLLKGAPGVLGLLSHCRIYKKSFTSGCNAIHFLSKLLDRERNKEADEFLKIICELQTNDLKSMRLHEHILCERGTKIIAFRLMAKIYQRRNNFLECIEDEWSRKEFCRWFEFYSLKLSPDGSTQSSSNDIPKLNNLNISNFSERIKKEVIEGLEDDYKSENKPGWKFFQKKFLMRYFYEKSADFTAIKFKVTLKSSPQTILSKLNDEKNWELCPKYIGSKLLKQIDDQNSIIQCAFKSSMSLYKSNSLCLFKHCEKVSENNYIIALHSVHTDLFTLKTGMKNSSFLSSGLQIKARGNESVFEGILKFKDDAIPIFSSDIIEESDNLIKSFEEFVTLCEK